MLIFASNVYRNIFANMTAFIWETKATPLELPPLEEIHEMKWKRLQAIESLEIFDHSQNMLIQGG